MIRRYCVVVMVFALALFVVNSAMATELELAGTIKFRILALKKSIGFDKGNLEDGLKFKFSKKVTRITIEVVNHNFSANDKKQSPVSWTFFSKNVKELDILTGLNPSHNKKLLSMYKIAIKQGLIFSAHVGSLFNPSGKNVPVFSMTSIAKFPKKKR